ncbi:MAG: succinate dehydrogenase cytochrome b subunit [Microthrixaceae bacterium]
MTKAMNHRPGAHEPVVNGPHKVTKPWPVEFYSTAVGKKWVMGLTGVGLMGFVFAHMFGNLKMFLGEEAFDHYAEGLRTLLMPIMGREWVLWGLRAGLIAMVVLHIHSAFTLTRMNHAARPVKYQSPRDYIAVNFASRTMRWTGIIIFLFVLFHLADLTLGWTNPNFHHGAAYNNLVASFERPLVAALYIACNIALGIHLFHGAWSMFQSMGLNNPRYNGARRGFAVTFAVVVAGINCFFPIAVQLGIVG